MRSEYRSGLSVHRSHGTGCGRSSTWNDHRTGSQCHCFTYRGHKKGHRDQIKKIGSSSEETYDEKHIESRCAGCTAGWFIQISFIAITIFANQRGLNDAAAVGIVEKIIGILFLVPSSMLSTISALASQNIGAGKHDRVRLTLRYVLCMTVGYGLVAATIVQFVSVTFVGLFTNDGAVQILGGQYLRSYAWDCVFAGVHFCLSGYFYAYGLSIVSFIHNSISIICARIPLSYYAATHFPDTLFPMGCAAPAGSIISIIICVGVLIWMNKHSEKYMGNNKSEV